MSRTDANVSTRPIALWQRLPVIVRAVITGLLVCLPAANVITVLAIGLGSSPTRLVLVALLETTFLTAYLGWTRGGGPPRSLKAGRVFASRAGTFSAQQWLWGVIGAVGFAITIHAAMVVVFRLVPFPTEAFHRGYDFSPIPTLPLKLFAVVLASASAAITEETGFRGYMQRPIELRHGAALAILVSTAMFVVAHLSQSWAVPAMQPIGILVGVLLGLLAWSSGSLIPGMIAHTLMDVGLFAYWWTGIVGTFTARTIGETGVDAQFGVACAASILALSMTLAAIWRLKSLRSTISTTVVLQSAP